MLIERKDLLELVYVKMEYIQIEKDIDDIIVKKDGTLWFQK